MKTNSNKKEYEGSRYRTSENYGLFGLFESDDAVFTRARRGSKKGDGKGWNSKQNLLTPTEARERVTRGANVGLLPGESCFDGRLVLLDDEQQCLAEDVVCRVAPSKVAEWITPHVGRNHLLVVDENAYELLRAAPEKLRHLVDDDRVDLEILTKKHGIVPPASIRHSECSEEKPCDGTGMDQYKLVSTNPVPRPLTRAEAEDVLKLLGVDVEDLPASNCDENAQKEFVPEEWAQDIAADLPDADDVRISEGESALRIFQRERPVPFNFLVSQMRGKAGAWVELQENTKSGSGGNWTSLLDSITLRDLFGALVTNGISEDRAREVAYTLYSHYLAEHPWTNCGESRRRWLNDEEYRATKLQEAIEAFDEPSFKRFWRRADRRRTTSEISKYPEFPSDGKASDVNYDMVRFALDVLTGQFTPLTETVDGVRGEVSELYRLDTKSEYIRKRFFQDGGAPLPNQTKYGPPLTGHESGLGRENPTDREVHTRYPTAKEIHHEMQFLGSSISSVASLSSNLLAPLKESGEITLAKCYSRPNGGRYVYYPTYLSAPEDADVLEISGVEYWQTRGAGEQPVPADGVEL